MSVAPVNPEGSLGIAENHSPSSKKHTLGHAKKWLEEIIELNSVQLFLSLLLFITLFLPDIWVLSNIANTHDVILNAILLTSFVFFFIEMACLWITRREYRYSFFFCMDLLGTLSILLDVTMVASAFNTRTQGQTDGSVLRAARVAKIGAKSGRLAKLVRLFRLLFSKKGDDEKAELPQAFQVSVQLSKILAQRVAALVMIIIVAMPLLTFTPEDLSPESFVEIFNLFVQDQAVNTTQWPELINEFYGFYNDDFAIVTYVRPIEIIINGSTTSWRHKFSTIRRNNEFSITPRNVDMGLRTVSASFNEELKNREDAMYSIILIILVILLLLAFSASFNSAVETLVVIPLQRIISSLRDSASSILQSVKAFSPAEEEKEDDGGVEELENMLETELLEILVAKLARIVNHVLPGSNRRIVEDMNLGMDSNTADWLTKEYLTEDSNEVVEDAKRGKQTHIRQSRALVPRDVAAATDEIEKRVNDWNLDSTSLEGERIFVFIKFIFTYFNTFEEFEISDEQFTGFISTISRKYSDGAVYHNWKHAFDVTHTVYRFITLTGCHEIFNHLEIFSLLVAVVAHDVSHPGLNNNFLVTTKHELAILHNDRSPLENMHCATLYDVLKNDSLNVFRKLSDAQWRDSRKLIIGIILNTDMTHHFQNVSQLQVLYELEGKKIRDYWCAVEAGQRTGEPVTVEAPQVLSEKDKRLMLLEVILHAADISNPIKPWPVYEKWANLVMEEFFQQGDRERAENLEVSAMYDREIVDKPVMQVNFMEFIVVPLYLAFLKLCPGLDELITHLLNNHEEYCKVGTADLEAAASPDSEAIAKMRARPGTLREKFVIELGSDRVAAR